MKTQPKEMKATMVSTLQNTKTRRPRILFVGEAVTLAHVVRPLQLAKSLNPEAYEIHFATAARSRPLINSAHITCHGLPTLPADVFRMRLEQGKPLYDKITLEEYVRAEIKLLKQIQPDLIVGDFRVSLAISSEVTGIHYVNLCNAHWSPFSKMSFPVPEIPLTRWVGPSLCGWILKKTVDSIFKIQAKGFNQVRQQYGLATVKDIRAMYTMGSWTLYLDLPTISPVHPLPDSHSFLGPVTWSPDSALPSNWQKRKAGRPLVYVTLGSSGDLKVLDVLITALGRMPVFVMLATAGRIKREAWPENIMATDYLPAEKLLPHAKACIFNGGAATGYQALKAGVPVLGLPSNADQFYHTEGVVRAKAGLLLRPSLANAEKVESSLNRLLNDATFREAAERLRNEITLRSPTNRFQQFVHEILNNQLASNPQHISEDATSRCKQTQMAISVEDHINV